MKIQPMIFDNRTPIVSEMISYFEKKEVLGKNKEKGNIGIIGVKSAELIDIF